jgi:hypothetical protein
MTRLLLIIFLVLSSGPAYAEWVAIGERDAGTRLYVDRGNIHRKGDLVKMWELWDFKALQASANGSFLSSKAHREYDCAGKRQRRLQGSWFSGHMGKETVLHSDSHKSEWVPVKAYSPFQALWNVACRKS